MKAPQRLTNTTPTSWAPAATMRNQVQRLLFDIPFVPLSTPPRWYPLSNHQYVRHASTRSPSPNPTTVPTQFNLGPTGAVPRVMQPNLHGSNVTDSSRADVLTTGETYCTYVNNSHDHRRHRHHLQSLRRINHLHDIIDFPRSDVPPKDHATNFTTPGLTTNVEGLKSSRNDKPSRFSYY